METKNTVNQATQLGIDAYNQSQQLQVQQGAQNLIGAIVIARKSIAQYRDSIKVSQDELEKISLDVITQRSVLGFELTGELNANQVTILNVIKKMNEDKQKQITLQTQGLVSAIKSDEERIALQEKSIAVWIEQLTKLQVNMVTSSVIK